MTDPICLSLIVARARNGVIGQEGELPWRLKDDLAHFKRVTLGAPLIMGRRTWESLPVRPLPGRANIVLSRDCTYDAAGGRVYASFVTAWQAGRAMAARDGRREVFVIGGAAVYTLALPFTQRIYLTEVEASPAGDTHFPPLVDADWREVSAESRTAGSGNDHAFRIRILERRQACD